MQTKLSSQPAPSQSLQVVAPSPSPQTAAFADRLALYQSGKRRDVKGTTGAACAVGGTVGATVGLFVGIATGGPGLAALPALALGGAALAGAIATPAIRNHQAAPRPDALRLHVFKHMGVVQHQADSEKIMAALKRGGMIGRGRDRPVRDLGALRQILDQIRLHGRRLTDEQCTRIATILRSQEQEVARRSDLHGQIAALNVAIEARRKVAPYLHDAMLQSLQQRRTFLVTQFTRLPSARILMPPPQFTIVEAEAAGLSRVSQPATIAAIAESEEIN